MYLDFVVLVLETVRDGLSLDPRPPPPPPVFRNRYIDIFTAKIESSKSRSTLGLCR